MYKNKINELLKNFKLIKKESGKEIYVFEGSQDIIQALHGTDIMPDDFRFETIVRILDTLKDYNIHNENNLLDYSGEICNNLVDIYNQDLLNWLSSNLTRVDFCDEATSNFGASDNIIDTIRAGQYTEIEVLFCNIVSYLTKE